MLNVVYFVLNKITNILWDGTWWDRHITNGWWGVEKISTFNLFYQLNSMKLYKTLGASQNRFIIENIVRYYISQSRYFFVVVRKSCKNQLPHTCMHGWISSIGGYVNDVRMCMCVREYFAQGSVFWYKEKDIYIFILNTAAAHDSAKHAFFCDLTVCTAYTLCLCVHCTHYIICTTTELVRYAIEKKSLFNR